jgi:hypothetical protein
MDEIISRAILTKEEAVQLFESGIARVIPRDEVNLQKVFTSVDEILSYNGEFAFEPNSGNFEDFTEEFVENILSDVSNSPQEDYLTEVTREEALRLFKSGRASVYMLYDDNSEGAVESVEDIEEYDGRFGFEHDFRDTAYIAEIREFLATPEISTPTGREETETPSNAIPTYKPGDIVYLDNQEFVIERMYEDSFENERVDILPTTGYPVTGIFHVADLNRQLCEDSRNNKYFPDLADKPIEQTEKKADKPKRTTTQNPNQESFFDMTETPEEVSATSGLSVSETAVSTPTPTGRERIETPQTLSETQPRQGTNYHLPDSRDRWEGDKTRYTDNVAAIKTLKLIESEEREATSEEKEVLSRYVGWGGLPNAFNGADSSWIKEYRELNDLLAPEEYKAAQKSTLNAHYTSTTVIDSIYQALEKMGLPNGSRILEPSCGIGNFIGRMPESLSNCHVTGVELDSVTGRIASKL